MDFKELGSRAELGRMPKGRLKSLGAKISQGSCLKELKELVSRTETEKYVKGFFKEFGVALS